MAGPGGDCWENTHDMPGGVASDGAERNPLQSPSPVILPRIDMDAGAFVTASISSRGWPGVLSWSQFRGHVPRKGCAGPFLQNLE